jgi:hypothetical protein
MRAVVPASRQEDVSTPLVSLIIRLSASEVKTT